MSESSSSEHPAAAAAYDSHWSRRKFFKTSAQTAAFLCLAGRSLGNSGSGSPVEDCLSSTAIATRKKALLHFYVHDTAIKGTEAFKAFRGVVSEHWHGIFYVIPKLVLAKEDPSLAFSTFDQQVWDACFKVLARHADCKDFLANGLLRIHYLASDSPLMTEAKKEQIRNFLLNFSYWLDEPEPMGNMWSENHQILWHTAELLAGQLYPDDIFTRVNQPGRWRVENAEKKILNWLDHRARFGFSEWLSSHYYCEDFTALVNLADFANSPLISARARTLMDLMFFEIATNSWRGVFNPTQGRVYAHRIIRPDHANTSPSSFLFWDWGNFRHALSMSGISFATSPYEPPLLIRQIARDLPVEMENRQRSSADYQDMIAAGIDPRNPLNFPFYRATGNDRHREFPLATEGAFPEGSAYFEENDSARRAFKRLTNVRKDTTTMVLERAPSIPRVDPYTYRTPEFMLSCAQDFQAGRAGYQHHIWHATLGEYAQIFTNDPSGDQYRRGQFGGNATLPKAVACRNVVVCLYRLRPDIFKQGDGKPRTHAWFPRFAFDEIREENGWVFARKGQAFAALKSLLPATWLPPEKSWLDKMFPGTEATASNAYDYHAEGENNAWICELGNPALHGDFEKFVSRVGAAEVKGDTESLIYASPTIGKFQTGWSTPTTLAGKPYSTRNEKRFDNPYCQAEFGTTAYEISFAGQQLRLDLQAGA